MPYQLKIEQPNLAEGADVLIHGLGTYANGQTHEVTDEEEENFRIVNSVDTGGVDDDPESDTFGAYVPNIQPGPSLLEANILGVTATDASKKVPGKTPRAPVEGSSDSGAPADKGGAS